MMDFDTRLQRAKATVERCSEEAKKLDTSSTDLKLALSNAAVALGFAIKEAAKKPKTSVDDGGAD